MRDSAKGESENISIEEMGEGSRYIGAKIIAPPELRERSGDTICTQECNLVRITGGIKNWTTWV